MNISFKNHAERHVNDGLPIYFSWPRSGADFTADVSFDGGDTYSPISGTIEEITPDGDNAEYRITYSSSDRPAGVGTVLYRLNDGTDTGKLYVDVKPTTTAPGSTVVPSSDLELIAAASRGYGPKRVRTKDIEIEQFDPLTVMRARSSENPSTYPTFCSFPVCRVTPAARRRRFRRYDY